MLLGRNTDMADDLDLSRGLQGAASMAGRRRGEPPAGHATGRGNHRQGKPPAGRVSGRASHRQGEPPARRAAGEAAAVAQLVAHIVGEGQRLIEVVAERRVVKVFVVDGKCVCVIIHRK